MLKKSFFSSVLFFALVCSLFAEELSPIKLPPPDLGGGKPLVQCLQERKSSRAFSARKLPMTVLSNLLWAANGINRPESGKRTAPSGGNWQEVDLYVAMEEGLFLYEPQSHSLIPVLKRDLRTYTTIPAQPSRESVERAPVQLIYVSDLSRIKYEWMNDDAKTLSSMANTGCIVQNVYLYCASEGLATVVRGLVNREILADHMKLRTRQQITLVQAVGYQP